MTFFSLIPKIMRSSPTSEHRKENGTARSSVWYTLPTEYTRYCLRSHQEVMRVANPVSEYYTL
jgi:hypothetical protein